MTGRGGAGGPYWGANGGGGCAGGGGGGPTIRCQDFSVSTPSPSVESVFLTGEGSSKSPLG